MIPKFLSSSRPKNSDLWTVIPKTLPKRDRKGGEDNSDNRRHKNNLIKTTKYTMWNFLPKNLFEQFHRFANLYFLFIIVLNFIPQINAFGKEISMIPLLVVLGVTAIKDLIEDRQRYTSDKVVNNRMCDVYLVNGDSKSLSKRKWRTIEVGDIIKLHNDDIIPSDILLLSTSDEDGVCHVSTANLDGENNLKQKKVPKGFAEDRDAFDVESVNFQVKCELPNPNLHKFYGYIVKADNKEIGVSKDSLLLRGCVLKNTEFIYGLVIYAGHDTKSMLNDSGPGYKRSQVEKDINKDVVSCVIILFTLCLIGAICCGYWTAENETFEEVLSTNMAENSHVYEGFLRFWTFVIILQVIIPISLYVSVEIVKGGQVFFINRDAELFYEETSQYPVCRATNINEDLGQIQYIFSDKTGTLTENKMVFKRFSVLGSSCLHPEGNTVDETIQQCQQLYDSFINEQSKETTVVPSEAWDEFFTTLAISNTVVVSKQPVINSDSPQTFSRHTSSTKTTTPIPNGTILEGNIYTHRTHNGDVGAGARTLQVPGVRTPVNTPRNDTSENGKCLNSLSESMDSVSTPRERLSSYSRPLSDRLSKSVESITSWLDCGLIPHYEYESADEGALVKAASVYGYTLANRTTEQVFFTASNGDIRIFDILQVLKFDSVRKRMSIIVRDDRGQLKIYCKGADTEIMSYLHSGQDDLQQITNDRLEEFAREGLRTLCIAKKDLSQSEYDTWLEAHKAAELSLEERDDKLSESASRIETQLTLLGATGIEDKLQDGVSETIAGLKNAGINLWILTGDKQETAVNIGFSCKVLNANMKIITINSRNEDECKELLDEILKDMNDVRCPNSPDDVTIRPNDVTTRSPRPGVMERPMALIIDGVSLSFTLRKELNTKFINIAKHCESVICCRATPLQKGAVVQLVRDHLKVMTLAIGDGANDVTMLKTAEVGIGIAGEEGIQAVMASDFVIGRFRFLKRLLLLHGFWCYDRLARMILYFFYKNTMFIGVLFWYQLYNGFSGSNALDDISLILFNLLFTSIPPIIGGIWDQCLEEKIVLSKPMLYRLGQQRKLYTRRLFWLNMLDSLFQSAVLFFVPYLTFSDLPVGMWAAGVTFHQVAVITANLQIGIETPNWTWIHFGVIVGSVLVSYLFYFIYCALAPTLNVYWIIYDVMTTSNFWLLTIFCPTLAVLPRVLIRVIQTSWKPSLLQQVRQFVLSARHASDRHTSLQTLSDTSRGRGEDDESIRTSAPT